MGKIFVSETALTTEPGRPEKRATSVRRFASRTAEAKIRVVDAVLEYPIGPYRRGSLKASLLGLVGGKQEVHKNEYVAALRRVSFDVKHGERVGLIGHNGSGKTTTLRALAGVYPLKSGRIEITGRIGTLLDIGLGFELESSGRENIFYRALAMGIAPSEIRKAQDDIIAFADIGEFIDLPIRTYSSGMMVRLGFAISTQFAPDVLLVDEVFATGDASFAEKAVERMNAIVAHSGIMVMASHDMSLLREVCDRVIWIEHGQIKQQGDPETIIAAYLASA